MNLSRSFKDLDFSLLTGLHRLWLVLLLVHRESEPRARSLHNSKRSAQSAAIDSISHSRLLDDRIIAVQCSGIYARSRDMASGLRKIVSIPAGEDLKIRATKFYYTEGACS
jgi:hypothetical protein